MSRNAALNSLRNSNRITPISDDSSIKEKQSNSSIEENYYAKEKELIIRLTVCRMPEQRRRIFEMSRYMGMDNQTIATTLNISKKTVENHLTLALKTLRSMLTCWLALICAGGGNTSPIVLTTNKITHLKPDGLFFLQYSLQLYSKSYSRIVDRRLPDVLPAMCVVTPR